MFGAFIIFLLICMLYSFLKPNHKREFDIGYEYAKEEVESGRETCDSMLDFIYENGEPRDSFDMGVKSYCYKNRT